MSGKDDKKEQDFFDVGFIYDQESGFWISKEYQPYRSPKCECGTTITMGREDHPQFHSDYCPIKENYLLQEALRGKKSSDPEKKDRW